MSEYSNEQGGKLCGSRRHEIEHELGRQMVYTLLASEFVTEQYEVTAKDMEEFHTRRGTKPEEVQF